jgi:hypothetical protein
MISPFFVSWRNAKMTEDLEFAKTIFMNYLPVGIYWDWKINPLVDELVVVVDPKLVKIEHIKQLEQHGFVPDSSGTAFRYLWLVKHRFRK